MQAVIFARIYEQTFAPRDDGIWPRAMAYTACGAVLSWSFTTLAVAAKNVMASVPHYLLIEAGLWSARDGAGVSSIHPAEHAVARRKRW